LILAPVHSPQSLLAAAPSALDAPDAPDANATAGSPHVLDDDRLAERCTHFFGEDAPNDICRSTGSGRASELA
jgi:hypothetical protein